MAGKTFSAAIAGFAEKTKAAQEAVLKSSLEDVMAVASVRQESWRTRSGPAKEGAIPVDTGYLVNTQAADVNGTGEFAIGAKSDVSLAIEGMGAGDYLHVAWTAPYAQRINSGFVGTDSMGRTYNQSGVHFVEIAAEKWSDIVQANAEFLKV